MKLNLKNVFLSVGIFVFTFALFGLSANKAEAIATCTATTSGPWTTPATWGGTCNANTYPGGPDTVIIPTGIAVTITADAAATSLTLSGTSSLTISTTNALSVGTGGTTIGAGSTLTTNGGTYTTYTLSVSGLLNLGTGPSTVSTTTIVNNLGEIRLSGASGQKTFSTAVTISNGGTYNETAVNATGITFSTTLNNAGTFTTSTGGHSFGGVITNTGTFNNAVPGDSMTTLAASTVGTFNYTGGAQTVHLVNYYNLGLSGSGSAVKTIGVFTVLNNFTMSGTAQASLIGDSTVAGTFTSNGSAKAKGTWGSNSSLATHQDNVLFADTGTVAIATGSAGTSTTTTTTDAPRTTTTTTPDTTAPTGISVSINAGALTTSSLSSTLTFTAVDATQMLVSNDAGFAGASWETFATSKALTLTSGDGVKTVYAKFKDAAGNMSVAVSDIINVSGSGTVAPVVVNPAPEEGCSGGNLINPSTGHVCVNNSTPQGCSGGNLVNSETGQVCVNNAVTQQIPGCGNRTTGFSASGAGSCIGNRSTGGTINPSTGSGPSAYNLGTVTLKNGSKGAAVMELQRLLNQVLNLGLVVDGKLGPKTIAVIKTWQKNHNLVADGLVGKLTKAAMKLEAE